MKEDKGKIMPSISVIVPTYNRAHFLPYCLESILCQTLQPFQIIVVDDGSTDNTPSIMEKYGGKIEYYRKANGGKSSAINFIRKYIRGSHIWIMDDDDIAIPTALEKLSGPHNEDASLGYSFGFVVPAQIEEAKIVSCAESKKMPFRFVEDEHIYRLLESNYISLNSCLIRTAKFLDAGLFDEYLVRSQDYDFLLRLTSIGTSKYIDTQVFWVREHASVRGSSSVVIPFYERNKAWQYYDKIIGRKIFEQFSDNAFIHPVIKGQKSALYLRPITFRKAYICATKNLIEDVVVHLKTAASINNNNRIELHKIEQEILLSLFNDNNFIYCLINIPSFRREVFESLRQFSEINPNKLLSRRLYWNALSLIRRKKYMNSISLLWIAVLQLIKD